MLRIGKIRVSGGAMLAAALLFYFDGEGLLPRFLLACTLHELGHWTVIRRLGGTVRELCITAAGAELRLAYACQISYGGEIGAALAGPMVNFLAALAAARNFPVFSGINLVVGAFNLLPVPPLDGGRILRCLLACACGEERTERICDGAALGFSLILGCVGAEVLRRSGYNFTLLLIACWLLFLTIKRKRVANRGKNG